MFSQAHALLIGISDYHYLRKLSSAPAHDVQYLRDVLASPAGYPASQVNLLLNEAATKPGILTALQSLAQRCDGDSTVWISFASHGGHLSGSEHRGEYLLPIETQSDREAALAQSAISTTEWTAHMRCIPARKLVLMLDCCLAGGIGQLRSVEIVEDAGSQSGFSMGAQAKLAAGRGRALLLASRDTEQAHEVPGDCNCLFTKHLLAGLRGGTQRAGGLVRVFEPFEYGQPRVVAEAPRQHPVFKAELEENFPIARYPRPPSAPSLPADGCQHDVLMAQHLVTEQRRYRLLRVLRQDCMPPLGIRIAPLLDLTPTEDFDAQIERLVHSLRQPVPSHMRS